MPPVPALLRGVDRSAFAVALVSRLRDRGASVGLTGAQTLVRAMAAAPPLTKSRLYWTARVSLVRCRADLAVFDAVFAAVFDDAVLELDPHARRAPLGRSETRADSNMSVPKGSPDTEEDSGLPWVTLPPTVAAADDSDSDLAVPLRLPGRLAGLADVPFEHLSPAETTELGEWLQAALRSWPARRSRRWEIASAGHRIALRPTLARARRTGWEPIDLVRVRPLDKPRRLVMICDVSQSMQAQACAYLHLMRALTVSADAEVFAFATTLTRLTTVLAHKSAEVAIEQATAKVDDRFGGTRIATNLAALLSSHHGSAVRGAVVIIGSDGWDSDPPEQLAVAMARLRRRAHRVLWINPRAAAPGFRPEVASMVAALDHCDALLPADTFASLAHVISAISESVSTSGRTAAGTRGVSSRGSRGSRAESVPR